MASRTLGFTAHDFYVDDYPPPIQRAPRDQVFEGLRLAWHRAGRPGEGTNGWTAAEAMDAWIAMQLPECGDA